MRRRDFLASAAALAAGAKGQTKPPNIVLILADDLGYGDLGCYGQQRIRTPRIDALAAEGVRFTQAYAGSTVCAPSRCALMTGYHTGHGRTRGNQSPDLPLRPQDVTLTELLHGAGYRTGLFGKWSLGELGSTGYPTKKGFDEWFGTFSQLHAHNYYPEHLLSNETAHLLAKNMGGRAVYGPDVVQEKALAFIGRDDPRPFFAHLTPILPHANNERGAATGNGMEVPSDGPYGGEPWPQVERNFAAVVSRLDRYVGEVLDTLRRTGKDRDTLVLFTSDNGPHSEGGHSANFFHSSGPLRGIKRDLYEGGIRVPAIARWPGKTAPGRTSDHPWAFWDLLPTLCDAAGARQPAGIDGISLVPELSGRQQRRHEYLYWEFHENRFAQAVRMGDWKGVRTDKGKPLELYDLKRDPGEASNVAGNNPAIVKQIEGLFREARTESEYWPAPKG